MLILSAHSEFDFARSALRLGAFDYILKPPDEAELAATLGRAATVIDERRRRRSLADARTRSGADAPLLAFFAEFLPESPGEASEARVERAVKEIRNRYKTRLSVGEVATTLGISSGHLARLFKAVTGFTFAGYLVRFRMRRAAELLQDPSLRIGEVADLVGYGDQRHFALLFRRLVGLSPTEFRDGRFGGSRAREIKTDARSSSEGG